MERRRNHALVLVGFLVLPLCLASHPTRAGAEGAFVVVVHPGNAVDELSRDEIVKIFRGEVTLWPDGRRIQVIDYTEAQAERAAFYRMVYHTSVKRRRSRGSPYVFRPLEQATPALVRRLIAVMPNAVAYLPADEETNGLKVVARIEEEE